MAAVRQSWSSNSGTAPIHQIVFEATHGYVLLLMLAAVVSATCAGGFLFVAPDRAPNRLAAALLGGASFWARSHASTRCSEAWGARSERHRA